MSSSLGITYVLPSLSPTGGALVVYRHAGAALVRGHRVTLLAVTPKLGRFRRWVYRRFLEHVPETLDRFGVRGCACEVPRVDARSAPEGDVVVATSFETAEWVAGLPSRAGRPAYFLQGYEAWTPELEQRVDATWRLPLVRIAVSRWLVDLGRERLGVECHGPVGNGVDAERFRPRLKQAAIDPQTVGAIYDTTRGKGCGVLLEALHAIARARPGTRFLLFGRTRPKHRLPPRTRYVWNPSWDSLPGLYRQIDIFLHASIREGWGLPPMEAMASGCALVATPTGGVPEFADETCARLVPPGDANALSEAALRLLGEPEARLTLGTMARQRVLSFGWDGVCKRMMAELEAIAAANGNP